MQDDTIPPELQDLLGASTFSQIVREAAAPTISFDENELTVQIFESSSPIDISRGGEISSFPETPTAGTPDAAGKISASIVEKRSLEKLPLVRGSRYQPYVKGMIDATRHRSAFKTIRNSEVWNELVKSCVNYVEGQLAEAAR